jgi:hypothetical protein
MDVISTQQLREEIAAEMEKAQADERARFEAEKRATRQQLAHMREVSQAKTKEGGVALHAVFLNNLPPSKKSTANTANAGQGGGTGKEPPVTMVLLPSVASLAAAKVPDMDYRIINSTTIEIPSRSGTAMKKAREALKDAKDAAKSATSPAAKTAAEAAVKAAEEAFEDSKAVVDWVRLVEGVPCKIKTFQQGKAKALRPLTPIQIMGLDANHNVYENNARSELQCTEPIALTSEFSPYITLSNYLDLQQQPVRLPDPNEEHPGTLLLYFANYFRTPQVCLT